MPWDIFIQDLPDVASAQDIPADHRPRPIGERAVVIERILAAVPFAEQQDEDWFFVRTPEIDLSISLNMEDARDVRGVVVHVHGGERSAACVAAIVDALEVRAIDTATGDLFRAHAPQHDLAHWADYRATVLSRS